MICCPPSSAFCYRLAKPSKLNPRCKMSSKKACLAFEERRQSNTNTRLSCGGTFLQLKHTLPDAGSFPEIQF
jgi:hypothetical protein